MAESRQGAGPFDFLKNRIVLVIAVVIVIAGVGIYLATRGNAEAAPTPEPTITSSAQLESVVPSAPPATTESTSAPEKPSEAATEAPSTAEPEPTVEAIPEDLGDAIRAPEESKWDYASEKFAAAWANPSVGKEAWLKAMEPYATDELLAGFEYTDIRAVAQTEEVSVSLSEEIGDHRTFIAYDDINGGPLFEGLATRGDDGTWKVSKVGAPPKG